MHLSLERSTQAYEEALIGLSILYILIRTYYKPEIIKDDGHLLHLVIKQTNSILETSFELTALHQFDQVMSDLDILKLGSTLSWM